MQSYIRPLYEGLHAPSDPDEICASPPNKVDGLGGP